MPEFPKEGLFSKSDENDANLCIGLCFMRETEVIGLFLAEFDKLNIKMPIYLNMSFKKKNTLLLTRISNILWNNLNPIIDEPFLFKMHSLNVEDHSLEIDVFWFNFRFITVKESK